MGVAPGVNVYEPCLPPWKKLWNVLTQQCQRISGTGNSLFPGSWLHPWTTWPPRQLFLSTEGNLISNQLCVLHLNQTPQRNGKEWRERTRNPWVPFRDLKSDINRCQRLFSSWQWFYIRETISNWSKQASKLFFLFNLQTRAGVVPSGLAPLQCLSFENEHSAHLIRGEQKGPPKRKQHETSSDSAKEAIWTEKFENDHVTRKS